MLSSAVLPSKAAALCTPLQCWCHAGRAAEAVREMRQAGLPLGVVIYTSLLNAYARAGDVAAAQQVLQDMKAAGVKPNNHTYSSLMAAHSQLGDVSSVMVSCPALPALLCPA